MKRTILFIALFIFIINSVSAQMTFGPKVGLNLSKENYGEKLIDDDIDFRAGLNVGFFGKYKIKEKLDIQAELLYSQQGYKDNVPIIYIGGYGIRDGYKILSHYLNIPVLLKYYVYKGFYIEAGPQLGFCFGARLQHDEKGIDEIFDMDRKLIDFSVAGGVGIDISSKLSINARYNHGFTEIAPESDFKNRVIQISLSYNLWSIH